MGEAKTTVGGKRMGCGRVSSADQNDTRQLNGVTLDKISTDKAKAKATNLLQLQAMLEFVLKGDLIFVHSMHRLSRSLSDLQSMVERLTGSEITVTFVKESLTLEFHQLLLTRASPRTPH